MGSLNKTTLALMLGCVFAAGTVQAGPCDAYYKFDGNLSDSSGGGNDGMMVTEGGKPSTPDFVEGRFGQGLKFNGDKAMRAFVDLSYDVCPKMTFMAWIKTTPASSQTILGVANRQYIMTSNKSYYIRSAGKDLSAHDAVLPNMGWMFIAATWDAETKKVTLHWRNRTLEEEMGTAVYTTSSAFWLGALNDAMAHSADDMVLDEVRLVGEVLSQDQILAMRNPASGAGPSLVDSAVPVTTAGPSVTTPPSMVDGTGAGAVGSPVAGGGTMPDEIIACTSHEGCAQGSYCGWDRVCHPDSHAPMQDLEVIPLTPTPIPLAPSEPDPPDTAPARNPILLPSGPVVASAVAGRSGSIRRDMTFPSYYEGAFLNAITWKESGDRPCEFGTRGWIPSSDGVNHFGATGSIKVGSNCSDSALPIFDSNKRVSLNDQTFAAITSLRVCNNDNNNFRLKGITIQGTHINEDGSLGLEANVDSHELTNCKVWSDLVRCESGKVATGIRLHASPARGDRAQVTGMQLLCQSVGARE